MKRKIAIWTIFFVALIAWTMPANAQTAAMKTVKIPNGEVVFDISGEWDVLVEHYDQWAKQKLGDAPVIMYYVLKE